MLKGPLENKALNVESKALTFDELNEVFSQERPTCFLVMTRDGWKMVDTEKPESLASTEVRHALEEIMRRLKP